MRGRQGGQGGRCSQVRDGQGGRCTQVRGGRAGREVHTGAWRAGVSGEHDGHNICTDQTGSSCNASFTQFCFYLFIAAGKNMDIFYSPVPACKD